MGNVEAAISAVSGWMLAGFARASALLETMGVDPCPFTFPMPIVFLGASRGVGLYTALEAAKSQQCTLILRNLDAVQSNADYKALDAATANNVVLRKGDANDAASIQSALDATPNVDTVVFSIGSLGPLTLKGIAIDPPDVTSRAMTILLPVLKAFQEDTGRNVRLIICSTMGVGDEHKHLPFLLKPMYSWALRSARTDKEGMEWVCREAAGLSQDPQARKKCIPADFKQEPGWLRELVIVRPAILSDGAKTGVCRADDVVPRAYYISRRDAGHFIATQCLRPQLKWVNRAPTIAY